MLTIAGLHKRYGDNQVLNGVDLQIAPGQVLGLLGRNGAGKTTMLSIVAGLLRPDAGQVLLDGHDVSKDRALLMASLGFVPQDLAIYPTLTVSANLRFFADVRAVPRADVAADIARAGESLLLGDLMDRKAGELSGGEKRRLHAAIGLLGRPRIVLLDEPTVGADAATRSQLLQAVKTLASNDGTTFVYTSHYTPEIEAIADHVAVLHEGQIRTHASVDEVIDSHGQSRLELEFSRPVTSSYWTHKALRAVSLPTEIPSELLAKVLADLDHHAAALTSVDIVRPSLESAYLALTETPPTETAVR